MWFRFPTGTTVISVNQQEYNVEARDKEGQTYFRAPDHFAAQILDLPGFVRAIPPEGATDLGDLVPENPAHEKQSTLLAGQVSQLKLDVEELQSRLGEVAAERDDWKLRAMEAETELGNLKAESAAEKEPETAPPASGPMNSGQTASPTESGTLAAEILKPKK